MNSGYWMGSVIGAGFAVFLIAYIVGWLAWRIMGRKQGGGRIAFCLMAALALLSQFSQFAMAMQQKKATDEVVATFKDIQKHESLYQSEYPRTQQEIPIFINKVLKNFDISAAQTNASDPVRRQRFSELREVAVYRLQTEADYAIAMHAMQRHYANTPAYFRDEKNTKAAIYDAQQLPHAGEIYRKKLSAFSMFVKATISEKSFPGGAMLGFHSGVERASKELDDETAAFVKSNNDLAESGIKLVELLVANKQKWRVGKDNIFEFDNDKTLNEFSLASDNFRSFEQRRITAANKLDRARAGLMPHSQ